MAGANGTTAKDDAKSEGATDSVSDADSASPMPADGIRPSFTPSPAATRTPATTPTPAPTSASSSPSAGSASSPPSEQQRSTYSAPSAYSRPPAYTAPSGNPAPSTSAQPNYSRSAWQSAQDTATSADSAGFSTPNGAGAGSSDSGFSSTATAAAAGISGAAAGLAGSVSGFWQKRSERKASRPDKSSRGPSVRRSSKRQAMLTLSRLEPWSVMKFSFVASVVAFIILFVAVAVLYMVLDALGVFQSLQHQVSSITSSQSSGGTNISKWFRPSLILGWTAMLGALNIVLITALSTIGSVVYNLIAKTVGGIEVTLRETD